MKFYTITSADVGQLVIIAFDHRMWPVVDFMGRILPTDVGKRVYLDYAEDGHTPFLQVENNEQRAARWETEEHITSSMGYLQNVLRCVNSWLSTAGRYCEGDRTLGNVLEHIKAAQRQLHAAEAMAQRGPPVGPTRPTCECADSLCGATVADTGDHPGGRPPSATCIQPAIMRLFPVNIEGGPVDFCGGCGDNALQSGAFATCEDVAGARRALASADFPQVERRGQ